MPGGIIRLDEGWRLDEGHHFDQPPAAAPPTSPTLKPKKQKGTKTMGDFIPKRRADEYQWWKNIRDNIETEGPHFSLAPADATAAKTIAIDQVAKMEATDAAKVILDGAREAEGTASRNNRAAIREHIRNWKGRAGFPGSSSEGVLQVKGSGSAFDRDTFKTRLKVSIVGGQIKIDFIKSECDGMVIYGRLRGQTAWTRLGIDNDAPYYDTRPLANPGVPEVREYMARGIIDDVEIGVESDIVSITLT